jgi:hypothetical protein
MPKATSVFQNQKSDEESCVYSVVYFRAFFYMHEMREMTEGSNLTVRNRDRNVRTGTSQRPVNASELARKNLKV